MVNIESPVGGCQENSAGGDKEWAFDCRAIKSWKMIRQRNTLLTWTTPLIFWHDSAGAHRSLEAGRCHVKISDFCQTIDKHLTAENDVDKRLALLGNALQQAFKVKEDEIAILRLDAVNRDLGFIWPRRLVKTGHIPLNTRDSLVARTAREGRPIIDNHFTNTRHASIFEKVSLSDRRSKEEQPPVLPIQKIMSVPVQSGGELLGVLQLSRKGVDPDSAGPDFTPAELEAFAAIANTVAGHIPW